MGKNLTMTLLLVLVPCLAFAQRPEGGWQNLRQLIVGQKIEVVDMKLKSMKGTFVGFTDETVTIRNDSKKEKRTVERSNVLRVSRVNDRARKRNILLGTAIGAGAGAGGGAAVVYSIYDEGDAGKATALGVGLTSVGAALGAALGAASGSETIYRAKRKLAVRPDPTSMGGTTHEGGKQ